MYVIKMAMRTTPAQRLTTSSDLTALLISVAMMLGMTMKSPTDRNTAMTMATPMTILSMLLPNVFESHFSNFVGSSSSTPSMRLEASNVFMPITSMLTMFTAPRTMGQPIHLCFFAGETYGSHLTQMEPSGLRTAIAMLSGAFIITPSRTACPPISTRPAPGRCNQARPVISLPFFFYSADLIRIYSIQQKARGVNSGYSDAPGKKQKSEPKNFDSLCPRIDYRP